MKGLTSVLTMGLSLVLTISVSHGERTNEKNVISSGRNSSRLSSEAADQGSEIRSRSIRPSNLMFPREEFSESGRTGVTDGLLERLAERKQFLLLHRKSKSDTNRRNDPENLFENSYFAVGRLQSCHPGVVLHRRIEWIRLFRTPCDVKIHSSFGLKAIFQTGSDSKTDFIWLVLV